MAAAATTTPPFYRPAADDGATFVSTVSTRGPWSPDAQHGGPPCALLGTRMATALVSPAAADGAAAPAGFRATRLTFEILRPVPIAPLRVAVQVLRAGQQAAWLDATLFATTARGEVEVLRARGMFVRQRAGTTPTLLGAPIDGPEVGVLQAPADWKLPWDEGYHTAIDLAEREPPASATGSNEPGERGRVGWIRPLVPLVEGEPWTPLGRVLVAVDSIGGVCARLPFDAWTFVNGDTTCQLAREPEGEWVALAGGQAVASDGVGLAYATLYDVRGAIGAGLQSQVVAARPR